jgi:hypothetical protein
MADLTINSVSAPVAILSGSAFNIDVSVTASADSVEDGSAWRLFAFVNSLLTGGLLVPPIALQGHLGDTPWTSANNTFHLSVTAGTGPDIYSISVVLMEGHAGIDPENGPGFSFAGPTFVL